MARLIVSPPSLPPSHPPTLPPTRWPVFTTLPPLTKFQLVWRHLCESAVFFPRWSETSVSAVSSSLRCRKYIGRFAVNMTIKSSIIFADTVDALTATFVRSLNTTIVEGPIERHKSRLASRATGNGLTGTYYSGGSLDRIESVPK